MTGSEFHANTRRSCTRRVVFLLLALALSVAVLEVLLHAASLVSPQAAAILDRHAGLLLPDDRLIHRPNPAYPEHDAWGFRNDAIPQQAFAVALGDSQTYGAMVPRKDAWPQQLATATGKPIYNMAFGGYGAGEASLLLDQALELNPDWVLFGLYTGNDLFDAYELAYKTESLPEQRTTDGSTLVAIKHANAEGTIESAFGEAHTARASTKKWFAAHSKVYGLARATRNALRGSAWQETEPEWSALLAKQDAHPDWEYFEHESAPTIFTPNYRLVALDQTDPRIREGERITLMLLSEMAKQCAEADAQFAVVALPTKESAYQQAMQRADVNASEALQHVWRDEAAFWQQCKTLCAEKGIPFIDTLPPLQESLAKGERPFRRDPDGHLTALGNQIVSETIERFVVPPSGGVFP